jgi:hypothetical protein
MGLMAAHVLNVTVYTRRELPVGRQFLHLPVRLFRGNRAAHSRAIFFFYGQGGIRYLLPIIVVGSGWLEGVWTL